MKDFLLGIDYIAVGICLFFILSGLGVLLYIGSIEDSNAEKECVNFYKENGYVLDICEKFEDKLEALKND